MESIYRYLDKLIDLDNAGFDVEENVKKVLSIIESGLEVKEGKKSIYDLGSLRMSLKLEEL